MRALSLSLILCLLPILGKAGNQRFHFSPGTVEAYNHVMALRLDKGMAVLEEEKKKHGNTPAIAFVEEYHDFLSVFTNEQGNTLGSKKDGFNARMKVFESADKNSPFTLYSQAEALIHRAALRMKFNDYVKGVANVRSAYQLLEKNIQQFPDFQPHYKSLGILEVLIGTVPPKYQWVTGMLGLEGNIDRGMQRIKDFMYLATPETEIAMLKQEAVFLYGLLQVGIVKEKEEAWKVISKATANYRSNLLHCFVRATVAQQCKMNDEVIRVLENRPKGKDYIKFYQLEYLLGTAKLHKLDPGADIHFKIFVTFTKGENHIKMAYLKLAWSKLIQGDKKLFDVYTDLAIQKGHSNFEEDKLAEELAKEPQPNLHILKGRLLFDGGYLQRAISELKKVEPHDLARKKEQVELTYRRGRVYHEMGQTDLALKAYAETMESGKSDTWYFAANSALKSARIYEEKGDLVKAKVFYEKAMSFPNDEYKQGIDLQAKAGLKRIQEK